MASAQYEVIWLAMTRHVFCWKSLLNITAGVKGQTRAVSVKASRKCQPTLLHVNHLQRLQFAVQGVGSADRCFLTPNLKFSSVKSFPMDKRQISDRSIRQVACSARACVCPLQVLQLPPTVQKHASC